MRCIKSDRIKVVIDFLCERRYTQLSEKSQFYYYSMMDCEIELFMIWCGPRWIKTRTSACPLHWGSGRRHFAFSPSHDFHIDWRGRALCVEMRIARVCALRKPNWTDWVHRSGSHSQPGHSAMPPLSKCKYFDERSRPLGCRQRDKYEEIFPAPSAEGD